LWTWQRWIRARRPYVVRLDGDGIVPKERSIELPDSGDEVTVDFEVEPGDTIWFQVQNEAGVRRTAIDATNTFLRRLRRSSGLRGTGEEREGGTERATPSRGSHSSAVAIQPYVSFSLSARFKCSCEA
jgi:hypothetical protein